MTDPRMDGGFRWCDPSNEGHYHRCGRAGHIAARCIYNMPQHVKDWVLGASSFRSQSANQVESFSEQASSASHFFSAEFDAISSVPTSGAVHLL